MTELAILQAVVHIVRRELRTIPSKPRTHHPSHPHYRPSHVQLIHQPPFPIPFADPLAFSIPAVAVLDCPHALPAVHAQPSPT